MCWLSDESASTKDNKMALRGAIVTVSGGQMNVVNSIMRSNENKHWITVNDENLTYCDVLKEAIDIRGELGNKLNTNEYNYVLFSDPEDIKFNISLIIALTQSEGISICFNRNISLKKEDIYLKNRQLFYKKVDKCKEQEKGLLITKTSGTTGEPKYILYSLKNKIDRAIQMRGILDITKDDRMLLTTNFSHSLGLRILFTSLLSQCKLEVPSNLTGEDQKAIIDKKPTKLIVVSLVLANAIEELKKSQHLIESIMLSSSSASVELKQSLMKMKTNIYEMYGASEVGTATVKKITDSDMKSLGKTLEDTDLIIDQETNEIRVQTKNICIGYLNKELEFTGYSTKMNTFKQEILADLSKTGELEYLGRLDKGSKAVV